MQQQLEQLKSEQKEEKSRWVLRESHLITEIDQGKQKNLTLYDEISHLKDRLNLASLENQNQQHQIDKLKTNLEDDKKHLEEKSNDWLAQLEQRELKLEKEVRLHESRKAELQLAEKRLLDAEASEATLKQENQDLRKETDRLHSKCEALQRDAELNFKEKIKDVNETFILRITNLEANVIAANKENHSYMS